MNYLRLNQGELRAEVYQDLVDCTQKAAWKPGESKAGRRIVLPSSYQGSPRAMHQNYLDAMAIMRKYGKPYLFITFTANPAWREIQENLRLWESASDRPELVARVFHLKMQALLEDIVQEGVLGQVQAYTWVIEFQKRGLPHLYMLVILHKGHKIKTATAVDQCVAAELPRATDSHQQSELLRTVLRPRRPSGPRAFLYPLSSFGISHGFPESHRFLWPRP